MGNVISAGLGQAPAKQAALGAGLGTNVPCTTVNKVCASGLKAAMFAAQQAALGHGEVFVAGGMESMTNAPYLLPGARAGMRFGHGVVEDGLQKDGLWCVYNDKAMGSFGDKCATEHGFSREDQDAFALRSYNLSQASVEEGRFADEIEPVMVPQRRGDPQAVDRDEEMFRVKKDKIPALRPAFEKNGTVTAANASTLNDGAAALIITSAAKAEALGLTPLARIRGYADAAQAPADFTTAPALAVPIALQRAGLEVSDVEYHEINEAFAVVPLANAKILGLDQDRINVNGGAVSMGHPIGASGARILVTLLSVLQQKDASIGCASICNGGGGAGAMVIERL